MLHAAKSTGGTRFRWDIVVRPLFGPAIVASKDGISFKHVAFAFIPSRVPAATLFVLDLRRPPYTALVVFEQCAIDIGWGTEDLGRHESA